MKTAIRNVSSHETGRRDALDDGFADWNVVAHETTSTVSMIIEPQLHTDVAEPATSPMALSHESVRTQSLYLGSGADATFARVHLPASTSASGVGVLISPPFGWHEICTYRARRTWADALARSGYAALRVDFPSTGDSGGAPQDGNRVDAWAEALDEAARWLRTELGCVHVVALGLGFGGLMAWRAAAAGAPIDDFILWGVPRRGARLLRELDAAAKLVIEPELEFSGISPEQRPDVGVFLPDGGVLEEGGQLITRETAAELSSIDLAGLRLGRPEHRRVLVFERPGLKGDTELVAMIRASGIDVSTSSGEGWAPMMSSVQLSVTPHDAIRSSLTWLDDAVFLPEAARPMAEPVASSTSIDLVEASVTIRERPVEYELPSGTVRGVLAEPVGCPDSGLCAVFFNGGIDRRIGPNRMWVETARRWAASGSASLRVDTLGVGDADGDAPGGDDVEYHYAPGHVARTVELLDALQVDRPSDQFVIVGFCSGAYRALHTALVDRRVAGVFAISLAFFFKGWWTTHFRDTWVIDTSVHADDSPGKARARSWLGRLPVLPFLQMLGSALRNVRPDRTDRALDHLAESDTELLLMFKPRAKEYADLVASRRLGRLRSMGNVTLERIPSGDIRCRPLASQQVVSASLDRALERARQRAARRRRP
jgi:pimeloyl-ACP methyl ester carboxylesterase